MGRAKLQNLIVRFMVAILLCFLSSSFLFVAYAAPTSEKVSVFYPLQEGFSHVNENGTYGGYSYDYLMEIAQLTGWYYEFNTVEATNETITTGLEKVKNGELDIACTIVYSPALEKDLLFSELPYGNTNFTLIGLENNDKLNSRTLFDYPNLKVAIIEKATLQTELFNEYCAQKGLRYQPVYAKNSEECIDLVEAGKADLTISKDAIFTTGFKIVLEFAQQPYYFATSKNNKALMDQINISLSSINAAQPGLQDTLHNQYFFKTSRSNIALTPAERQYLEQAPAIRTAIYTNQAPLQSYNKETQQFEGILVDILQQISKKSGLKFDYVAADNNAQVENMIKNNGVDIVLGVPYYYACLEQFYENNLLLTTPILSSPVVLITGNTANAKKPGILLDSTFRLYDGDEAVHYEESIYRILTWVNKGIYAKAYSNSYTVQYNLDRDTFQNITLTSSPYNSYELCIGVSRSNDLKLVSILDQAIATLPSSVLEDIIHKNTISNKQFGLLDIFKRNPVPFALGGITIFVTVCALLLSLFLKTRHINKMIFMEKSKYMSISQTDGLTQIYNNATFRHLSLDFLNAPQSDPSGALLILDIDYFKSINDSFGHLEGDAVLRNLAKLLQSIFAENAIVGRMGGDEFTVLLKYTTNESTISSLCKELARQALTLTDKYNTTLSIGAAIFHHSSDFEALFKVADAALYHVKAHGRNNYHISFFNDESPSAEPNP